MSAESEPTPTDGTADAHRLASQLGTAITELPVYERFEAARHEVEQDDAIQAQIDEFEQIRQEFMLARQTGQADQAALKKVQNAQQELNSQPAMAEFLRAKSDLQETLTELNDVVSAPLAVDFGGEAGGCCQD